MGSEYYRAKIEEMNNVKGDMYALIPSLSECSAAVNSAKAYTEKMIISGKSFDDGKLMEFSNSLSVVRQHLNNIINECSIKIEEYKVLYQQALDRENAERMKRLAEKSKANGSI